VKKECPKTSSCPQISKRLLALKASAGTGKTYCLSRRYLELLKIEKRRVYDIVAITFTKKAALEMYNRILEFLEEEKELKERFLKEEVSILTSDSLLHQILRKFSYFQGLRSDFTIQHSLPFYEQFIESLDSQEFEKFLKFAQEFEYTQRDIQTVIENILYEKDKEVERVFQEIYTAKPLKVDESKIVTLFNQIVEIIQQELNSAPSYQKKFKKVNSVKELLELSLINSKQNGWLAKEPSSHRVYKKVAPKIENMFQELKKELKSYFKNKEQQFLKELYQFYFHYKEVRKRVLRKLNILDFTDVRHFVYDLLQGIDKEFLYFRLDNRITHLLIDEFQDTSLEDWSIFEPIVDEIATNKERTFFYVGDTKQAIFGFRGGRAELFDYVAKKYRMEVANLECNYRSRANIVEYVNEVYNLNQYYTANAGEGGYVEVSEVKKEQLLEEFKKKLLFLLESGVREEEITVLVRTNKDIITVSEFLEKELNKKAITSASKLVINQLFPRAIISYLYYWRDRSRKVDLFNFERVAKSSFKEIKKDKPISMIKTVAKEFNLFDESVLLLIQEALPYNDLDHFLDEVEHFTKESPKAQKGIEIMTIHKAKGLSFPHTIVLDHLSIPRNPPKKLLFEYEGVKLKTIRARTKINKKAVEVDPHLALMEEKEKEKERIEQLNLVYVALTRAKHSLIVIKRDDKSTLFFNLKPTQKGVLEAFPSPPPPKKSVKHIILRNYGTQKFIEVEEEYQPNDFKAIYLGNAYHIALETNSVEYAKKRYGFFVKVDEEFKKRVQQAKEKIAQKFPGEKFKEIPFTLGDKLGMIDLLIFSPKEGIVIDYKSVTPKSEEKYLKQVNFYLDALSQFYPNKRFKGYLFYLDKMRFKEVRRDV